jgi:hypothetical protein
VINLNAARTASAQPTVPASLRIPATIRDDDNTLLIVAVSMAGGPFQRRSGPAALGSLRTRRHARRCKLDRII